MLVDLERWPVALEPVPGAGVVLPFDQRRRDVGIPRVVGEAAVGADALDGVDQLEVQRLFAPHPW